MEARIEQEGTSRKTTLLHQTASKNNASMSWQYYFDRVFVISLPDSHLRRNVIKNDFREYEIDFIWWCGSPNENGQKGISDTMRMLFDYCIRQHYSRVMVFEDDCQFMVSPKLFNETMGKIVQQAQMIDWIQIKLGSVLLRPVQGLTTPNLFQTGGSYGLHAVAYTMEFMEKALLLPESLPIDVSWSRDIESEGRAYHSWPLLCSQYPGESAIEKKHVNWDFYIQGAFKGHTEKINLAVYGNVLP